MPTDLSGYITKKDAARYNRSHRQLTRDIAGAIAVADKKTLANFKLRTDDDTVYNGKDVTAALVKKLQSSGKNPVWFIRDEWLLTKFGLKEGTAPTDEKRNGQEQQQVEREPTRTVYDPEYVALLKQQNEDLKRDKDTLMSLVGELTENQKENNKLTNQLHTLLANETGALRLNSAKPEENTQSSTSSTAADSESVDVTSTATQTKTNRAAKASDDATFFRKHTPTLHGWNERFQNLLQRR